ncbi:hypothetical protein D3C85_1518500 [compost metagenome]
MVSGSSAWPGFQALRASTSIGMNWSLTERSINKREPAVQTSPWLKAMAPAAAWAAACRSGASAKTTLALLPPASAHTRFMLLSPA